VFSESAIDLLVIETGVPFSSRNNEGGLFTGHGAQFPPQSTPNSPASRNPFEHLSTESVFFLHAEKMTKIVNKKAG
jgi:hypothetical protein